MKAKKAAAIILAIICMAVLIMVCLVAAFFVQFNGGHLDSLIDTDTLGEAFFNGGAVSRVIDCDVPQKNGIMVSKVYQNEMPDLETQFRFRFMSTSFFDLNHFFEDVDKLKLTDADGGDMTHYFHIIPDGVMGMDCMQIVISIPHNEIDEFANGLFFEVSLKNADDKTYADCKLAIPVEKRPASDS